MISKEVQNQILYFHSRTGKLEWSGFLLFEQQGGLENINSMVLTAKHIHLLDIGSETFTEIENYDAFELVDDIGDRALSYKMGIVHTHHQMATFFSGTDSGCLHENSANYPFLLSLIVNLEGKYMAKIAFIGKESTRELTLNTRLDNLKLDLGAEGRDVLITCDCKIQLEQEESTVKRYDALLAKKEEDRKKAEAAKPKYPSYGQQFNGWRKQKCGGGTPYRQGEFDWSDKEPRSNFNHKLVSDITGTELDDMIIKIVMTDLMANEPSLLYTLKRTDAIANVPGQEVEKGFYLDLIEDNFENFANQIIERDLEAWELSELANKINKRLLFFQDIEIVKDIVEVLDGFDFEDDYTNDHPVIPIDKLLN